MNSMIEKLSTKRWQMVMLLCSGIIVVYTLRVNMSIAAQDMRDELGWSESQKGLVLSSFYWGYTLGMVPSSKIVQWLGAKWVFGFSVLIPSVLTILVPYVCRQSFALALIIRVLIGFFESATFPAVFHFFPIWVPPAEKTILIPFIFSGMYIGEIIGFSLSGVLAGSSIYINNEFYGGWPSIFYFFGSLGVLWFPVWAFFAHESPHSHPHITKEELILFESVQKGYSLSSKNPNEKTFLLSEDNKNDLNTPILKNFENNTDSTNESESEEFSEFSKQEIADGTPWINFVTNRVSLVLMYCNWVFGWIGFTILSEIPSFLTDELGFDLESAGFLSVCPYFALFVANIGFGIFFNQLIAEEEHFNTLNTLNPVVGDLQLEVDPQLEVEVVSKHAGIMGFIRGQGWSVRSARVAAHTTAYIGSGACLILCGVFSQKYVAYTFMVLSQFFYGASSAGMGCAFSDTTPRYSSSLNSLANMMGAIAGICGPIIVAIFTEDWPGGVWGWRAFFFLTGFLSVISVGLFYLYVPCSIIPELNNPVLRKYKMLDH